MTATAGVWAEALRWATDAPVEVADTSDGGWEWSASVIVAVVAAVIAAASLVTTFYVGRRSVKAAEDAVRVAMRQTELQDESARAAIAESKRATQVAIEQTDLQRAIAIQARAAVVWADVRPHPDKPEVLYLMVGNTGQSVARDVRVRIDPPIPGISEGPERSRQVQDAARSGIASLVPGRVYEWRLGLVRSIVEPDTEPTVHNLMITWEDERGNPAGETFPIRVSDIWMTDVVARGSLNDVVQAIRSNGTNSGVWR